MGRPAEIMYPYVMLELEASPKKDSQNAAFRCAGAMLSLPEPPDAFLCFTDELAVSVAHVIRAKGLAISDDVGLIGFESAVPTAKQVLDFELTYVSLNSYESGRMAAQILDWIPRLPNDQISKVNVFHPKLVIGDSCKGRKGK